jgi:hypothetical protein
MSHKDMGASKQFPLAFRASDWVAFKGLVYRFTRGFEIE